MIHRCYKHPVSKCSVGNRRSRRGKEEDRQNSPLCTKRIPLSLRTAPVTVGSLDWAKREGHRRWVLSPTTKKKSHHPAGTPAVVQSMFNVLFIKCFQSDHKRDERLAVPQGTKSKNTFYPPPPVLVDIKLSKGHRLRQEAWW